MTQPQPGLSTSLRLSRTINAPRERVFQAWTDPQMLHRWWSAFENFTCPVAEVDLRVGGKYRLAMQNPAEEHPHVSYGVYREVTPPEKLVFTWSWEKSPGDDSADVPAETLVTVEFIAKGGSTEVVLTHEQFPDENMRNEHQGGWEGCLNSLARLLARSMEA